MDLGLSQTIVRALGRRGGACALVIAGGPDRPSAALVTLIAAKDHLTVRFAMARESPVFGRIVDGESVAILVADEGNVACFIHGRASVLKPACEADPSWAIIEVVVDGVEDITIPGAVVTSGIRVSRRRERVDLVSRSVLAELVS